MRGWGGRIRWWWLWWVSSAAAVAVVVVWWWVARVASSGRRQVGYTGNKHSTPALIPDVTSQGSSWIGWKVCRRHARRVKGWWRRPKEEREKEGEDRFRVVVLRYLSSLHSEYLGLHRLTWAGPIQHADHWWPKAS
jgi:hypothetical protein